MRRSREKTWFVRLIVATVYCGTQLSNQILVAADPAPDPDQEAVALVERMLQVNRPWLIPSVIQGSYSLLRKEDGVGDGEVTGPFALESTATNLALRKQRISRVGSIVWTPLHNMIHVVKPYSVRMVGKTNWNDMNLVAVDVAFTDPLRCAIGLGGQGGLSYSHADYDDQNARILIEPTNAIPVFIDSSVPEGPTTGPGSGATWQFDIPFFTINGGVAPQALEWNSPTVFLWTLFAERQEFQVHDQEWLFKRGDAWWGNENPPSEFIQSVEVIDLSIMNPPRMTIQKVRGNIMLAWPTYGKSGVVLESASGVNGLWSTVLSQGTSNITDVSVTLPANQGVQFYRLRR